MKRRTLLTLFVVCFAAVATQAQNTNKWTVEQANQWAKQWGWLSGCNFQPSTAINQLEMFQTETFDPATIDRELGWAQDLGFNCMRVYLHHAAWETDKEGFKQRLNQYLSISWKHNIGTIFVIFDDCWRATYAVGKQPEPEPGVHNSGWVRDPGDLIFEKPETVNTLEAYVKDLMTTFKNDNRIVMWDVYNEPGNSKYGNKSMPLLKQVFAWGSEIRPSQPLSAGIWSPGLKDLNAFQLENSDVITYHNYKYIDNHIAEVQTLKKHGRPMVCTEYMARRNGSLFFTILPMLKKNNVGAINWGFVSGKTNTIFAWDTPIKDGKEPELWFHDILRKDGTPFSEEEVELIKRVNKR